LVAAINRSTRSGISRALEILSTARANVSGLLINMIGSSDSEYHYGYYDRYYLNPSDTVESDSDSEEESDSEGEIVERVV
jgi:Mrp family chromosome partitioning ATPase